MAGYHFFVCSSNFVIDERDGKKVLYKHKFLVNKKEYKFLMNISDTCNFFFIYI